MKAVILAGGSGTRLWPMSRREKPKQFFQLVGEDSLLRDTYRRLLRLLPSEDVYFILTTDLLPRFLEAFPDVDGSRVIVESEHRDTAPAMGYAAALLERAFPDEPLVFVPCDHYIRDEERFLNCLRVGGELSTRTGKLVDIGIPPAFPSTALGYTKIGNRAEGMGGEEGIEVYAFEGHTEKPPYEVAKQYVESGSYLWHANYYLWTPRKFLEAIEKHALALGEGLRKIQAGKGDFASLERVAFDYAVTEKLDSAEVLIIRGDFGWSDIGAWNTLQELLAAESGNALRGQCVTIDTQGSLVYGPSDKLIAVVGLRDVVIVDTPDSLLVCRKQDAPRIKELLAAFTEEQQRKFC